MRIVIDTNVWASGLLWRGPAWNLLRLAEAGQVELCMTPSMLRELAGVLCYERLQPRLAQLRLTPQDLLAYAMSQASFFEVEGLGEETIVAADPADDVFLRCAVAARAVYVISGDGHLLSLGEYAGIRVLTIREFLMREFPDLQKG